MPSLFIGNKKTKVIKQESRIPIAPDQSIRSVNKLKKSLVTKMVTLF